MQTVKQHRILALGLVIFGLFGGLFLAPKQTEALSGSEFNAGNIIADGVFFNPTVMGAPEIQAFLSAKVPVCDTNGSQPYGSITRAEYGASRGYPPPYTCLKDYIESIPSKAPDSYCDGGLAGATKSAAQIIFDVAQACSINPKVLIVLLQKEQSLVTDDWPWSIQYRSATGYGCPDTAPCDSEYYGFFNQVYHAARQFQRYSRQSQQYNYRGGMTSYVQYNPNAGCGGSNIGMQNQATAGLYNYTPYQPNAAALANLYGSGDACSAYGNRNFWRMFNDWFGSTQTNIAFAWRLEAFQIYANPQRTQTFSSDTTVAPGGLVYIRIKAANIGNATWQRSTVRLGTTRPLDRTSQFYDSSWYNNIRPAQLVENSVAPGTIGSFEFALKAPQTPGTYQEYFSLVAENITWFNDLGASIIVNVVSPVTASSTSTNLASGAILQPKEYLLSPDRQSVLTLQADGNLVLYSNSVAIWNTVTFGKPADRAEMQTDGNFIVYFKNGETWSTGTQGHPGATLKLQTDGNVVIYDQNNVPLWNSVTFHTPDHLSYVNTTIRVGVLFHGQQLETADRRYRLVFQNDGNLVLYSPYRALWSANTHDTGAKQVWIQADGNLVIYDGNGRAIWNTRTHTRGPSRLVMQQDGNLVIYDSYDRASWNTVTFGQL